MPPTNETPPAELTAGGPDSKPQMLPGMSLADFADLYGEEPDEGTVAGEEGREDAGEVAPGKEPLHDLPDDGDEPETPEGSEPPPDAAGGEDEPPEDEVDLVSETGKRGWPKPDYKPEDLDDNVIAQKVEKHWKRVFTVSRQELADHRKTFADIDPERARNALAAFDELNKKPDYAVARAFIWKDGDYPEIAKEYVPLAEALVRRDHPHHVEAIRRWQAGGAPGPSNGGGQPFRDPIEDTYDPDTGELDRAKYDRLLKERDIRLAQAIARRMKTQPAPAPAADPTPEQSPHNYVVDFCDANDLDFEEVKPAFQKAFRAAIIDGEQPINSMAWAKKLWKRVREMREKDLEPDLLARQAEVARHKGASTTRPRTAKPEAAVRDVSGLSLAEFAELEASGQV